LRNGFENGKNPIIGFRPLNKAHLRAATLKLPAYFSKRFFLLYFSILLKSTLFENPVKYAILTNIAGTLFYRCFSGPGKKWKRILFFESR